MKKQSLPCIKLLKLICITKVGLVFLSSNFAINKISQGRKSVHGLSAAIYLRTVGQFASLEKSQVLGIFFFLSVPHPLFFQVCRTIFLCAKEMEIQVLDQNTMCIWSPNLMTPRGFFLLSLGIHNFVYMKSASKWKCSSQPKAKATRPNDHGIVAQHCEIGNGEFS